VKDVRHLAQWQSVVDMIQEYELLMFWNKCASNKQIIIMGQPGAEVAEEDTLKGLAARFRRLIKRLDTIDKNVLEKVDLVSQQIMVDGNVEEERLRTEVASLTKENKAMSEKMDKILELVKRKQSST
jgi:type IV secretory pathway protease TraF